MGNPPQKQKMVLDTGSELSWLQCTQSFNPLLSSSYAPIPCTSPICTKQTSNFPIPTICNANRLCQFIYPYADQTSVQGNLGTDTITLPELKIPNFVFGCNILAPLPGTPGLMGLGRGALSFISQIPKPNQNKFSYCIADPVESPNSPGVLLLGDSPFSKYLHYTPLYTISIPLPYFNRVAYSVRIRGIKVGKLRLGIPKSVFLPDHTGAGQTMIDSGTQFSFLVGEAYLPLRAAFFRQNQGIMNQSVDDSFVFQGAFDLCFSQPGNSAFPQVSPVTLLFDNRAHVKLQSHQLLYQVPGDLVRNGRSVYCFTFGNSDLVGIVENIIGNFHQQNLWVEYDLQSSRIGFARANCRFS
ncbi:hypothetical protein SUGI_0809790 [Cryptomeria japonica]|nr:hypothetical protein SUGI_0809790 [Cryptomeria japonica]